MARPSLPLAVSSLAELLARLDAQLRWERPEPTTPALDLLDGLTITILRQQAGRFILLCETAIHSGLPSYRGRLEARRVVERRWPGSVSIFTDAAHSELVWGWLESDGVTIEHRLPGSEPALWSGLEALRGALTPTAPTALPHHLRPAIEARVTRRVRRSSGAPGSRLVLEAIQREPGPSLQRSIEEATDPADLRAWWRAVSSITVLDPDCRDGGWLLQAAETLEPLYLTCLERMSAWLRERRSGQVGGVMRDFEDTLRPSENLRVFPSRRALARRLIAQRGLYGLAADRNVEMRCRRMLLDYAGVSESDVLRLDVNVRRGKAGAELCDPGSCEGFDVLERWLEDVGLHEPVEILTTAFRMLRELRLNGLDGRAGLQGAARQLDLRIKQLSRRVDLLTASISDELGASLLRARAQSDEGPVYLWLEFPGVFDRGGFGIVREPDS